MTVRAPGPIDRWNAAALAALAAGALFATLGCAGPDDPSPSRATVVDARREGAGTTRASRELAVAAEARGELAPPRVAPVAPRPLVTVRRIEASEGEDGRGALVAAVDAVAIELDAERFEPRARDPILVVGELSFTRYTHPSPGVLRFVAADAGALPRGVPLYLSWSGEPDHRVSIADALELP
ncbi:MAG: hypothetical protein KF729_00485 [Sandaracinaceae bacterium]|nr:hypothetical protein [Sandaracinaceae bacterium]